MPYKLKFFVLLATSSTLIACTTPNPQTDASSMTESATESQVKDWDSVSLRLSRGICFGACPSYIVEIKGDGTVNYCGRNFVKDIGTREDSIAEEDVQTLFNRFVEADFEALDDSYKARVSDLPSYKLRMAYDDTVKTVVDYGGRMIDMPPVVKKLQQAVDDTAQTDKWIGEPGEKQRVNEIVECEAKLAF